MGEGRWRDVPILHVIERVRFTLGNLRSPLLMNGTMGTGRPSDSCGTFQDARARLSLPARTPSICIGGVRGQTEVGFYLDKARGNPAMVSSASYRHAVGDGAAWRRRPPFGSQVLSVPRALALFILLGASTIRLNILRWRYGHANLKRRLRRPTGRRVSLNTPTRSRWPTTCAANTSPLQEVWCCKRDGGTPDTACRRLGDRVIVHRSLDAYRRVEKPVRRAGQTMRPVPETLNVPWIAISIIG